MYPSFPPFLLLQWSKFPFPPLQFTLPLVLWISSLPTGLSSQLLFSLFRSHFRPHHTLETILGKLKTSFSCILETFLAMVSFQPSMAWHGMVWQRRCWPRPPTWLPFLFLPQQLLFSLMVDTSSFSPCVSIDFFRVLSYTLFPLYTLSLGDFILSPHFASHLMSIS